MATCTTTVNVGTETCPTTPGTFQVKVHYTDTDAGSVFGPVSSRERAEELLIALAKRTDIKKAELEVLS